MGSQCSVPEEDQLSEIEKRLDLCVISPQAVFRSLTPFLADNSMHEGDFIRFAKEQRITLGNTSIVPHQEDFYFALRASTHHYKPRLALVLFTLYSNASDDVKADILFSAYSPLGPCPIEAVKAIIYNMIDISLNVSKKLVLEQGRITEYLEDLNRARKLLFLSVSKAIGVRQVSKELFCSVMVSPEFRSLLKPSGMRQRLRRLLDENKTLGSSLPFIPSAAS